MMDPLRRQARTTPDAPALDAGGVTWTYQDLDEQATWIAQRLAGAGLTGKTVAVLAQNGPKAAWALHGVPRAGATLCLLNPASTPRETVRVLDRLRPAAVLATHETEPHAARTVQAANLITLDPAQSTRGMHIETLPEDEDPPGASAADPHTIVSTSGTTGHPQLAAFSLEAHIQHAKASSKRLSLGREDRWLSVLQPAHVGGFALWFRACVTGATVVPLKRFDPGTVRELVSAGEVTHASLVPTMLSRVLEAGEDPSPPEGFRLALIGGAPCPAGLRDEALKAGWPIALTYGLTEAASQVATAPPGLVREKPGTVGAPLETVEVRIGEDDEMQVRGSTLMRGYVGEEDPFDEEGWLGTGDAGRVDGEGHVWVTGRISDRIVSGGVTVDPVEVERALLEHPGVSQAAVVGVPDEQWGELVHAAVVPEREGTLEAEVLGEFLEGKLSSSKKPRGWVFVEELPRNPNGKVDRAAVRSLFG